MLKASNLIAPGFSLGFGMSEKMLKASNLIAPGFSLGFGMCHMLRAESTPER